MKIGVISDTHNSFEETIKEFREGVVVLKKAQVYANRIDWLMSGDDGEDNFHKRLKEKLKELEEV